MHDLVHRTSQELVLCDRQNPLQAGVGKSDAIFMIGQSDAVGQTPKNGFRPLFSVTAETSGDFRFEIGLTDSSTLLFDQLVPSDRDDAVRLDRFESDMRNRFGGGSAKLRLDRRHLGVEARVVLGQESINLALHRSRELRADLAERAHEGVGQVGGGLRVVGGHHRGQAGQ